ncbi:MAG: hypothetical protein J6B99_09725 [Oscillospiraceae bacterium]|nr:hypothetical protein [Oscillospiraceae bacterium]
MRDTDHTVLHLSVPSVEFIEKMQALEPVIAEMQKGDNAVESIKKLYAFFAEIFSHNEDGIRVTAGDLRDVYKLNLLHLLKLYPEYMDFIGDIENAKN